MLRMMPLLVCLLVISAVPTAVAAPEAKLAVVDMLELINEHPDTKKLRTLFEKEQQKAREFAQRSKERLEKLRKEIEALPARDVRRRNKQAQFEKQAWNNEYDFKHMLSEARITYLQELETTHAAVRALVAGYARDHGIQLVLHMTTADLVAADSSDYVMKVALRTVVWFDTPLDITSEVKKLFGK